VTSDSIRVRCVSSIARISLASSISESDSKLVLVSPTSFKLYEFRIQILETSWLIQKHIYDVVKITGIYGSKCGDPQFNPNSDLDDDGEIKIYDVVMCTSHYGQSW